MLRFKLECTDWSNWPWTILSTIGIGHLSYSLHSSQHRYSYAHSPHQSFTIVFDRRKIL